MSSLPTFRDPSPLSDMGDLDALLAESMQEKQSRERIVKQKKLLASPPPSMPKAELKAIEAKVQEWETKREWTPEAAVAMFESQRCNFCNSLSTLFKGMVQRQSHRQSRIDRWVRVEPGLNNNLPKESKILEESVGMCSHCAVVHGFSL